MTPTTTTTIKTLIDVHALTLEEMTQIIDDTYADNALAIWDFWMQTQHINSIFRDHWSKKNMLERAFLKVLEAY